MIILLEITALLYAGYNVCIKLSGSYAPETATTPVLATICLQFGALSVSLAFAAVSAIKGGANFNLMRNAYLFRGAADISVGLGSLGYFYLFSGIGKSEPMEASIALQTVALGTIVIAMLVSALILKEAVRWPQIVGTLLILGGIALLPRRD